MNAEVDNNRRRFLITATSVVGGTGVIALAVPFISSMNPSARARTTGGSLRVDISKLSTGQQITVKWRGQPIWILRRSPKMLENLSTAKFRQYLRDPDSAIETQQPDYVRNEYRSIEPEYLIAIGICTHLGCVPSFRPDIAPADLGSDWRGGYFCPCHGSRFDLAGRVYRGVPAPTNLVIPPYRFSSATEIVVGEDKVAV